MTFLKITVATLVVLSVSALAAYVGSRLRPFVIEEEATIEATPAEVWAVLADLDAYPTWNPSIVRSEGELEVGSRLRNEVRSGDGSMTFTPEVLAADPGRELRWVGHTYLPGIADGEHSFVIDEVTPGRVRLTQREEFTGLAVPFAGSTLEPFRGEFRRVNEALADEVARRRAVASAR